jgi:hypothetical protein
LGNFVFFREGRNGNVKYQCWSLQHFGAGIFF